MNEDFPRDEQALLALHAEIEAGRIKVYRNTLDQPYICCDHPGFPGAHCHLFDKDFRGWVTHFIWDTKKVLLRDPEKDRIIAELAGRSMRKKLSQVTDPALLRLIESEPVLAVVLEFMHTRTRHENTMEALWKELRQFARDRHLEARGKNRFPGGANVLSRKLALFKPTLEKCGIQVEVRRSDGCKVTLIRRSDDVTTESSAEPTCSKSNSGKSLSQKDDRDERLAALEARRKQSSTLPERTEP